MQNFDKIKIFLICLSAIIANCKEVSEDIEKAVDAKILPLSSIATITDGKLERNKRGLLDHFLSQLQEYFDYSEEDDSEQDEKYLICRNCTVVVSQSGSTNIQPAKPNGAPSNGDAKPPNGASNGPTNPETTVVKPNDTTEKAEVPE